MSRIIGRGRYATETYPEPPRNSGAAVTGPPDAVAYYDHAGNISGDPLLTAFKLDAFQRPQIHDTRLGPTGRGAVYRLGSWSQDGDALSVTSEGYVTYGANALGLGPDATQGGMGFYEPNGFGVYNVIPGVNGGNTFLVCGFEDGSVNAPFGYQGFQINSNNFDPYFHVDRTGPNAGFVFVGLSNRDPYGAAAKSSATLQNAQLVANAAQYRSAQYGANSGVPGISAFKSRGATIGSLVGLLPGDLLCRITASGVTNNNADTPLAAFITLQVPAGWVPPPPGPPATGWLPSEYELQLVPLAGPINSRRVVFKVTSEGETESLNGVRVGGPDTTPATIATVGALVRSGNGDPEGAIVGSVGDLWLRLNGGAGTTLYVKESGAATNTGWAAK